VRGASAVAAAAFAFALAGCGGSGGSTPRYGDGGGATDGRSVFVQQCGSCHRLADAGTEGVAGKSLDEVRPTAAACAQQRKA
jgi:mono/diheme cytochrome c family protein